MKTWILHVPRQPSERIVGTMQHMVAIARLAALGRRRVVFVQEVTDRGARGAYTVSPSGIVKRFRPTVAGASA